MTVGDLPMAVFPGDRSVGRQGVVAEMAVDGCWRVFKTGRARVLEERLSAA